MNIKRPQSSQPMPAHAKRVFKGVIFDVYQWEQKMYDGTTKTFEKLKRADTALLIPVTEDNKIIVTHQEQPGKMSFDGLAGGRIDEGEDPLEGSKRELLEETGYTSDDWVLFDAVQPSMKVDWAVYTFVARNCKKVAEQELDGGEKIKLKFLTFDEFVEFSMSSSFHDLEVKMIMFEASRDPKKMKKVEKMILGK